MISYEIYHLDMKHAKESLDAIILSKSEVALFHGKVPTISIKACDNMIAPQKVIS